MDLLDSLDSFEPAINVSEQTQYCKGYFGELSLLIAQTEEKITSVYHQLQDLYRARFKELANLVTDPLLYVQSVDILKNEKFITKDMEQQLKKLLPASSVLVLMVSSSHDFNVLPDDSYHTVSNLCLQALELKLTYEQLSGQMASLMTQIAPNLTQIVGSQRAAQLLTAAGGLQELCRVPSCNMPALGSSKTVLYGFSSRNTSLRNGILWSCDQLLSVPEDLQNKVVKLIAGKVTLAARIDAAKTDTDGLRGVQFVQEIDAKIEKMLEPLSDTKNKALPAPISLPKKKRGGKQARRKRERFAPSELQKLQNRIAFGVAEEEILVGDEFEGLGMLSVNSGVGSLRSTQTDIKRKAKFKNLNSFNKKARPHDVLGLTPQLSEQSQNDNVELPLAASVQKQPIQVQSQWLSNKNGFQIVEKKQ